MWTSISRAAQNFGPAPMYTWVTATSRIELSGTTFLNGVSKAANMLRDGQDVEQGDAVYCDLGNHWQSPVWLAATMSVQAILNAQSVDALGIVTREHVGDCIDAQEIIVISRDPFGMPERDLESSVVNGSLEVRGFGDHFSPMGMVADSDLVYRNGSESVSKSELILRAKSLIAEYSINSSSRISIDLADDFYIRLMWQVVIPVLAGCSVVLIDGPVDLGSLMSNERIGRHFDLEMMNGVTE